MADEIKISLDEVSNTASSIRTINTSMKTTLETIKTEINALSSTWQSDAGNDIIANFNNMSKSFEEYYKAVDSYATFLDDTVESYTVTEGKVSTNAEAFK